MQKQLNIISSTTEQILKKNTVKNAEFVLYRFAESFKDRELSSILKDDVLDFLTNLTNGNKQASKRNRFSTLSSFFNFTINTTLPDLKNPCNAPVIKKIFRRPQCIQWKIIDKDMIDEIIFRTMNTRNRIILELMARGGMRIGEVLKLTPGDIYDRKLLIQNPKSGREGEVVFIPQKIMDRLQEYVKDKNIIQQDRIFPISYVAAWMMVKKAGTMTGINLRPHDLRRHAATYASRSGTPIEIVNKVILRHADLSTTQRYLGKVSDAEVIR